MKIGSHDTGIGDWADKVSTKDKIGENLKPHEVDKLVKERGGAELLIEKRDENNLPVYDVYSLEVAEEGKTLHSLDIYENMSFEKGIPKKLGGEAAKIAADHKPGDTRTSYFRIEPEKATGIGNRLDQLGMSAMGLALNGINAVTGGSGGVPIVGFLNGAYVDERFEYRAEDSARLEEMKNDPDISPELFSRLQSTVAQRSDDNLEYNNNEDVFTQLTMLRNPENASAIKQRLSNYVQESNASVSEQNKNMHDALMYQGAPHLIERYDLPKQLNMSAEALVQEARTAPLSFINRVLNR